MNTLDNNFGNLAEDKSLNIFKEKFGENIQKTKQYDLFDFTDGETYIELKARRCYSYTYDDTMVGYNKIEYANKHPDKKFIFAFKFLDGLFCVNHQHGDIYRLDRGGRSDRGRPEYKNYCYIKKELFYKLL
jgi:hypothetical protein